MINLIKNAQKILVSSHLSPDLDAVCSTLLTVNTLKENFKQKEVIGIFEDKLDQSWDFLKKFNELENGNIFEKMEIFKPDLIIICDGNSFKRISRFDVGKIQNWVLENKCPVLIIDHHELLDAEKNTIIINDFRSSASEQVYVSFKNAGLNFYEGFEETLLIGILSDTGRFLYQNSFLNETFHIVDNLVKKGLSIETTWNKFNRYTTPEVEVLTEFLNNLTSEKSFNYSFLRDNFILNFQDKYKNKLDTALILSNASSTISNQFLRSTESGQFGFLIYKDITRTDGNIYKGSLRAISGVKDVSLIANKLGGGGHKAASGFRFEAENVEEAVQKVLNTLKE